MLKNALHVENLNSVLQIGFLCVYDENLLFRK